MNKNQLITSFIRKKIGLSEAVELLTEDRIPALVQKYAGTKTVKSTEHIGEIDGMWTAEPSLVVSARKITGVAPKTGEETVHKLAVAHDPMMEESLRNDGINTDMFRRENQLLGIRPPSSSEMTKHLKNHASHVIGKIAEVDPTPNKEYTERMVHWYSRSSDSSGFLAPHPQALEDSEVMRKKINEGPHHALSYARMFGYTGDDPAEAHSIATRVFDAQKDIHAQMEDAHQKLRVRMDAAHPRYNFRSEDFGRARTALETYHRAKRLPNFPKEFKDFNKINSLHHLEKIVEPFTEYRTGGEIKKEGATTLYEDDDVAVHHLKNHEAGCSYGAGTRWCFTGSGDRGRQIFRGYDKTSPLIVITDKKRKFNNPNDSSLEPSRQGNRYALHFGYRRSEPDAPSIQHNDDHIPSHTEEHQLMDHRDHPVNADDLARALPQLRKIPALQHQSTHIFQASANPEHMRRKIASGEVKVADILKHIHSFPELHRASSKTVHRDFEPETDHFDSAHNYLIGMMHGHAHPDHPVMKHFLGGSKEGDEPVASQEEQAKFFSALSSTRGETEEGEHPFLQHLTLSHIKRLQANPHITSNSKTNKGIAAAMENSADPDIHRHMFDENMRKGVTDPMEYRMLKTTRNQSVIQDAMKAVAENKIARRTPGTMSTTGYYDALDSHKIHQFIAQNPHTPDKVLEHIAFTKIPETEESLMAITNLIKRRESQNA